MSNVTTFDHANSGLVIAKMRAAMGQIAKEHGLSVATKRGNYADLRLNFQVEVTVTQNAAGEKLDPGKVEFERYADMLGVEKGWYRQTFTDRGTMFRVVGLKPSRPKNCVLIQNVRTGKEYVCAPSMVRVHMARRVT